MDTGGDELPSIPGTPPDLLDPPKGDAFAARNAYALKIDTEKEPPFFKVSDTHYAATWLMHPDAPEVTPPAQIVERQKKYAEMQSKLVQTQRTTSPVEEEEEQQ